MIGKIGMHELDQKSSRFLMSTDDCLPKQEDAGLAYDLLSGEDIAAGLLAAQDIDAAALPFPVRIAYWRDGSVYTVERDNDRYYWSWAPAGQPVLAVPVMADGRALDLLFIDPHTGEHELLCHAACWLGRDNIGEEVTLHPHPLDWLAAGGTGVCNVHPCSRGHYEDLRISRSIRTDDVNLALDVWDFGFSCDPAALTRIEVDLPPDAVAAVYVKPLLDAVLR